MADTERAPLLGSDGSRTDGTGVRGSARRAWRWVTQHAIIVFSSILILIAAILLIIFFGLRQSHDAGKDHHHDHHHPHQSATATASATRSHAPAPTHSSKAKVCNSPACVHASSEILYNLSPKYKELDACTNFEELVCGGWSDRHDLRPDQGDAFTGTLMSEASESLLRHILEAPYPDTSEHSTFSPAQLVETASSVDKENFKKLKTAYDSCQDEDSIKKEGIKPLLAILKEISALFPVKKYDTEEVFAAKDGDSLSEALTFLNKLGVSALVSLGPGADDKDPDTVVTQVSPPWRIGLPAKDYYGNDKVVQKYTDTITSVCEGFTKQFSILSKPKKCRQLAVELVTFEKRLADASPSPEDMSDVTQYYNPMLLDAADKLTPVIHLASILKSLSPKGASNKRIIVGSPSYMTNLTVILAETPKSTIQIYLGWKVTQAYYSKVDAEELKPYSRFVNELQGKDPDSTPERWRTCVKYVDGGLGWILSRFFVEKAFSEKAKEFGDQIVSDIKDTFIEKLKVTDWMDKEVVDLAIEKVHKIVQKIGYPTKSPNIMDPPSLQDYYRSVNISSTAYFQNTINMNRLEVAREWSSLGTPVDRDQWDMTVPTVNAYYNPPGNEIVFPAGIMQFPVFDVKVPQYLSYGAFGSVSGHELSHAFDSTGRHYDQNGNYTDWWTNSTVAGFKKRAECFVDQYAQYSVTGPDGKPLHVNGKLTLGENIADAGGVTAAFAAWKKRAKETPNEDLPGLSAHFTQDQLFFVSYANWWCGKSRDETAVNRIYTDPHAPKWARILGTMANSRDFKRSFGCKVEEPTCELW